MRFGRSGPLLVSLLARVAGHVTTGRLGAEQPAVHQAVHEAKNARPTRLGKKLLLMLLVFALLDFAAGRAVTHMVPPLTVARVAELEKGIRIRSPTYHHDLSPRVNGTVYWPKPVAMVTNSLGFRDRTQREVPLKAAGRRVLFIGDSFTEGLGVTYEQSFVGLIEDELAPKGIDVLNAGCMSYSPKIYCRKVKYLLDTVGLHFDELVVFIDISDIEDDALFYDVDGDGNVVDSPRRPDLGPVATGLSEAPGGLLGTLKCNSLTLRVLDGIKDHFQALTWENGAGKGMRIEDLVDMPRAAWTVDKAAFARFGEAGLASCAAALSETLTVLRNRGSSMTIAVYPWPTQIHYRDLESIHVRFWRDWASTNKVKFVDLFPPFFAMEPRAALARYYIPWDSHWNVAGHALIARHFLCAWMQ